MPILKPTQEKTDFLQILKNIGYSENEAAVYLSTLALDNSPVSEIAKNAKLNRTTAYMILINLRKEGLVASYPKGGILRFSAVSPDRLEDKIEANIKKQNDVKDHLIKLLPEFRALFHSQPRGAKVKVFEGPLSAQEIYRSLYKDAKYPGESLEITNWGGKHELLPQEARYEVFDSFAKNRVVTKSLLFEDEVTRSWVDRGLGRKMSKDIRLLKNTGWNFFVNMECYREKVAIVTYRSDIEFTGLLIESKEYSDLFKFMFDIIWKQAEGKR